MGSNRLWDAVNSGGVPIFTDIKQYDVVPFASLWRRFTLFVNESSLPTYEQAAKALHSVAQQARTKWPELVQATKIASKIVSWNAPGSRTLEAYIQLFFDRLRQVQCGTCNGKCVWTATATNQYCAPRGATHRVLRTVKLSSLSSCLKTCEQYVLCRSIDYYPTGWCSLYGYVCGKKVTDFDPHVMSYRLDRAVK